MEPPLVELDAGLDFKVLIVDDGWVVRWPGTGWLSRRSSMSSSSFYRRLTPRFDVHHGVFADRPERVRSGLAAVRSRL